MRMNGDLISRSAMLEKLDELSELFRQRGETEEKGFLAVQCGVTFAIEEVKQAPAEDAEIVRHGWWTKIDASYWRWKHNEAVSVFRVKYQHDECGKVCAKAERYCPDCGAKMYAKEDA